MRGPRGSRFQKSQTYGIEPASTTVGASAPHGILSLRDARNFLALADFSIIAGGGLAAHKIYSAFNLANVGDWSVHWSVPFAVALVQQIAFWSLGLYKSERLPTYGRKIASALLGLSFVTLSLVSAIFALRLTDGLPRAYMGTWFAISCIGFPTVRILGSRWLERSVRSGKVLRRFAAIGTPERLAALNEMVRADGIFAVTIEPFIVQEDTDGTQFRDELGRFVSCINDRNYEVVLLAFPPSANGLLNTAISVLGAFSVDVAVCTDLQTFDAAPVTNLDIGGISANIVRATPKSVRFGALKRIFDLTLCILFLPAIVLLAILIAVAIKLDSNGPVLFRQRRHGYNHSIFQIYKFRTMTVTEDGPAIVQAKGHDPRVTRLGRFLRRTKLDELPQLINVLKGEMSLVGPRPFALAHDQSYDQMIRNFSMRRRVKPGVTGWAQVKGRTGPIDSIGDLRQRLDDDLYYISNWSLWFDLKILFYSIMTPRHAVAASARPVTQYYPLNRRAEPPQRQHGDGSAPKALNSFNTGIQQSDKPSATRQSSVASIVTAGASDTPGRLSKSAQAERLSSLVAVSYAELDVLRARLGEAEARARLTNVPGGIVTMSIDALDELRKGDLFDSELEELLSSVRRGQKL